MSDGKIIIDTKLDTSGFEKDVDTASKKVANDLGKGTEKAMKQAEESINKVGKAVKNIDFSNIAKQMDSISKSIDKTSIQLDKQKEKLSKLKTSFDNATNIQDVFKINSQMEKAEASIGKLETKLNGLKDKQINLKVKMDSINGLDGEFHSASMKITEDLDKVEKKSEDVGNKIKKNLKPDSNSKNAFSEMGESIEKTGKSISDVGNTLSTHVTLPLVGLGVAATKIGMDFDSGMSRVKAISGATGEEFTKLHDQALQLGADTAFSAKQAAEGMENLASAGFSTNEIMSAMPGMLNLAASSGESLASSSDIAASTLRGFGIAADQAGHVADVLAKNASATNAQVSDTGEALKYVATNAHAAGWGLEETVAAIGDLSNFGIKGSQAGTTLREMLVRLASPSKEASDDMKTLGFNAFDSQGKMKSLSTIIGEYSKALQGKTDKQKQDYTATIFGQEAMSGMLALVQGGSSALDDLTNSYKSADGAAADMAKTMQDNSKSAVEQMMGSVETTAIKLEEDFAPVIIQICNDIQNLANAFSELSPEQQEFYAKLLLGAAAAGPVLKVVGGLTNGVGGLINIVSKLAPVLGGTAGAEAVATGGLTGFGGALAAIAPVALPALAAISALGIGIAAYSTAQDQMGDKLTRTTDDMTEWQKAINGMTGYTFKSKKELQDLGIEYKDFGNNISDNFKKKVEESTKAINEFQLFLGKIDLDGTLDVNESNSFDAQINKMVNDAISSINSKKSEMQKSLSDLFKLDDGQIDSTEQSVIDSISKGYDTQINEENKLKEEIIKIKQGAVDKKRALNEQEIRDIQDKVNKIKEIELEAVGGTKEEKDYAKNEFSARVESVSPEDAASLLTEKRKALDEENVKIKASYDTQLDTLKQHLKEEQDAILNATTDEERQKAQKDADNTQAEIDKFSQLKDKKLKMTQDEWDDYINILKQKNPEALAMVNQFTGEILSKEDKIAQGGLTTMKSTYAGLSNIVKSGTYELENTQTHSMENVTVSVDEATEKITGAYAETTGAVGGYTNKMAKDNEKLGQAHAELAATCEKAMNGLAGAHVDAKGTITDTSGWTISKLEEIKTAEDGTMKGVMKINGTPIEIKTNADGTISNLDEVLEKISKIPKGTQTDIKINGEEINTVDSAKEKLDEIAKDNPESTIKINGDEVGKVENAKKKIDEITASNPNATITIESSDADSKLDTTKEKADEVGAEQPNVGVTANTSDADTNLDNTKEKAEEVGQENPEVTVTANTEGAETGLDKIISDLTYIAEHPVQAFVNFTKKGGGGASDADNQYTGSNTLKTGFSYVNEHGWETANNNNVKMINDGFAFLVGNHYSGGDGINDHMTSVNEMYRDIDNAVNGKLGQVFSQFINTFSNQLAVLGEIANNTNMSASSGKESLKLNEKLANNLVDQYNQASENDSYAELNLESISANDSKERADKLKVEDYSYYNDAKSKVDDLESQIDDIKDKIDSTDSEGWKKELEAQEKVLDKKKDSAQKEEELAKMTAENEIEQAKKSADEQVKIVEEKKEKLTKLAEAVTTAIKNQLTKEKESADKTLNDELTKMETDYNNAVKKLEDKTKAKSDKIDEKIKALEEESTDTSRQDERTDANNNINMLKNKMANTASEADKRSIALQIQDAQKELNKKESEWSIEDQKASLEAEKEALSKKEETEKANLEESYNKKKKAKEKELKDTDEYYDKLLQEDSINAKARYTLLQRNNDEIVKLLNSYNPQWQNAGQSLVDSLIDGLNSKKQSVQDAVAEILNYKSGVEDSHIVATTTKGYASGTNYNSYAGLYNVDEEGFEISDSNNSVAYVSKGAAIKNHMQSEKFIQSEISKQVGLMRATVFSAQAEMATSMLSKIENTIHNNNATTDNSKTIKFNVEHFHNESKDDIEQIANELGFYAFRQRKA